MNKTTQSALTGVVVVDPHSLRNIPSSSQNTQLNNDKLNKLINDIATLFGTLIPDTGVVSISKKHVEKLNELTTDSAQINFPKNSKMDEVTYTTILEAQINYELCYDQLALKSTIKKSTIKKQDFLKQLLVQHHSIKNNLSTESAKAIVDIEVLCKKLKSYKLLIDSTPKFFDYCIQNKVLSCCIEQSKAIVDSIGDCRNNCVSHSKTVCEGIISSYAIIWLSFSSVRNSINVTQDQLRARKETDNLMQQIDLNFEVFYQALSTVKGDSDTVISESLKTHFYSRLNVLIVHFIRNFIDCKSGNRHQGIPNKSLSNVILLLQMVPRDYQFSCDHGFRDVDSILDQIESELSKNQQEGQSSNSLCEEERIEIEEELIREQEEQRQEQERQSQAQRDLRRNNINLRLHEDNFFSLDEDFFDTVDPDEYFFDTVDPDEDFFDPVGSDQGFSNSDEDSFYRDYNEAREQIRKCMETNSLETIEEPERRLLRMLEEPNSNNHEESTDMCHLKKLLVNYALADLYFLKGAFDFSSHVSRIQTDSTENSIKYSNDAIQELYRISYEFKRNNFNVIDQVFNGLRIQMNAANTRIQAAELSTERWLDRLNQSRLEAMERYVRSGYVWARNTDNISQKAQERREAKEKLKQLNELKVKMGRVQTKFNFSVASHLSPASNGSGS